MTTIALCNLGCSKNIIDGERILFQLQKAGFKVVEDFSLAEVILINTCAFIQEAKQEAIDTILRLSLWKKNGMCKKLIVSGCFSQRYRNEALKLLPEVDEWIGVEDWPQRIEVLFNAAPVNTFERTLSQKGFTQYLKIAEGCSHKCSFCAIPSIRGPFKSKQVDELLAEARWLENMGVKELILVAQDSSFYGRDIDISLTVLLQRLLEATAFPWIRIMYLHPAYVDQPLLDLIASEPRICPYFDMPLQHISDPILKAMRRRPLSSGIRSTIEAIRTKVPNACLRTSFIVGFPGEQESHFNELLRFVEETRFDKLGVFQYSAEEGTTAFSIRPRVTAQTAQRRAETLLTLQRQISRSLCEKKIGSVVPVIIDGFSENPEFTFEGRTQHDAPEVDGNVFLRSNNLYAGQIVTIRITAASDYDLFGEPV